MAPTIQVPAEHTLKALQNVLKKRTDANRILKEREKRMLNGEGYQRLEVNLNNEQFLQPADSDDTKASIYYIRQKFTRYCDHHEDAGPWLTAILKKNCNKGRMMSFLHWICETYLAKRRKVGKRKTVNQYWREFKMLYRRVNGCLVDANDSLEVVKYINTKLKVDFGLDTTSKPKPVAGPDDLLLLLVQHWARDESVFPTEDDRLDVATIMLFQSYTGGRPAEFVHASKGKASQDPLGKAEDAKKRERGEATEEDYDDESDAGDGLEFDVDDLFDSDDDDDDSDEDINEDVCYDSGYGTEERDVTMTEDTDDCYTAEVDGLGGPVRQVCDAAELDEFGEAVRKYKALCYEDIRLWIVQNPKRGERDLLAMEVSLRHHKGMDNKPKPTTFLFRENPLPILCPISHLLARAIRDDAILVDGYTSAEPFFATDLRAERVKAMKVHWKPEWLKRPVFRRSVWTVNGWVKSKFEPMPYSTYTFYISRLGRDSGLEDRLTSYCFRRGTANAVNGAASDAVRDQVLRHDPNTGTPSSRMTSLTMGLPGPSHMSIRCNPGAPKEVPEEIMKPLLAADPDIVDLERRVKELHTEIKWEYRFIKRAPKKVAEEYEDLRKKLKNAKKSLEDEIEDAYRKDYFFQIHNEMMKRQLNRQQNKAVTGEEAEEDVEPVIEHQLIERTQLQQILCDLSRDLRPQAIVSRKVSAINLFVALASRQEFQTRTRKPRSVPASKDLIKKESPAPEPSQSPDEFPVVCTKTQCIICIGNERLPYEQRTRAFKRVSHMRDHVENVHLSKLLPEEQPACLHPKCSPDNEGLFFDSVTLFKNHVAIVHQIDLRPMVFSY
ncbi:hypothetical protein EG329_008182 [Mollisiaceae sp. DMI_Dod_QoI]|nr:hypothetical protein EG329_008182 [Helotiales sp. DMI_Dod_QoI]